jgi:CHAD domain-containing protein
MAAHEAVEVERTFEVPDGTILPPLGELVDGLSMSQPRELVLEAVYFDTPDLALARRGVTLRRRTGGDDAGWHVKLPSTGDARTELRSPLGRATRTVPKAVLSPVRGWVRDHSVVPVARVTTRRLERRLVDGSGEVCATFCDDEVHAERLVGTPTSQDWREWEVELASGDERLLDVVGARLLDAGALPSATSSKLRRALGDLTPALGTTRGASDDPTIEELLVVALRELTDRLHRQDRRLREGRDGAVHKMRIAARRIRAALSSYAPLLEAGAVDHLVDELRWLGRELAEARDAQVLRERLVRVVDAEPPELVMGDVSTRIRSDLGAAERTGDARALAAIDGERYFRLLDDLDAFAEHPPVGPEAGTAAEAALPRLLQRDAKRLRRAVSALRDTEQSGERDAALHEVRKKAKRLRYAAELARPVLGKRAGRLARAAEGVQRTLGRHQDAVVARAYLREQGVRAHLEAQNGFTYGRLHALQDAAADRAADDFTRAWKSVPSKKKLRRWLAG